MNFPPSITRQVTHLLEQMDEAYEQAAASSGFACKGCEDNCCLTRFYHHTLLEALFLKSGLAALPADQRQRIQKMAQKVVQEMADLEQRDEAVRVMCPLNEAQRCSLYAHRPMICRLHGIPHTVRRPDGKLQTGPGCDDFYAQCGRDNGAAMERTPYYIQMAQVERDLRRMLGFKKKIKMTIAEIIMDDSLPFNE